MLQDAYKCASGESIDFATYTKQEAQLSLCWTNQAVDALNERWNKHNAKNAKKQVEVTGFKQSKFILHTGLKIMAYRSGASKTYLNSEEFVVKSFNKDKMRLEQTDTNNEIEVDLKFTSHFKPMYAMTVHKAQGMTINEPYSIYEYKRMKDDMLYVALTRTSKKEFVNFCDIQVLKPYVGFVYRYIHNGRSYVGSTTDVKKRREEHKTNRTKKFGRAIQQHGYSSFAFEILEKVRFSERQELYDLEDEYITRYDSINNGFNSRRNERQEA